MQNIETVKTCGKSNSGECSAIIGTAAATSLQWLINSSAFIIIILFAEMIKLTVDLQ